MCLGVPIEREVCLGVPIEREVCLVWCQYVVLVGLPCPEMYEKERQLGCWSPWHSVTVSEQSLVR